MNKQLMVWKQIADSLNRSIPTALLYVLESKGSSPGRQGFLMCVDANGTMTGSIGGGIMEHKFVEMAREQLQAASHKLQVRRQVHDKSAARDRSGMICSGEQTVLIYQVGTHDVMHINKIIECLETNRNGTLKLSANGIIFSSQVPATAFRFSMRSEEDWEYLEKIGYRNQLFIVGGGHCALALSRLMSTMDFYIYVFDERAALNTMLHNSYAHEKTVISSYEELKKLIPGGNDHYVVIMTFGYRTDALALRTLLDNNYRYLGLLGSKKKIQQLFEALKKEGIAEEKLKAVHSPVGIDIKSETPEEIAVSIAAEIIKLKNADF